MRKAIYFLILILMLGLFSFGLINLNKNHKVEPKVLGIETAEAENLKPIYLTLDADMNEPMHQRLLAGEVKAWYDPQIFDYLKSHNIKATFFVSGLFAEVYSDLIRDLNATGNYTFENHAYDESGFTPHCYHLATLTSDQQKIDQINKTQKILADLTGRVPTYFRFPGICHTDHDDSLVSNLGLKIDNGSVIASDPFNSHTLSIVERILKQTQTGSVILMHVGGPNAPVSFEVLKRIVPELQERGFSFHTL